MVRLSKLNAQLVFNRFRVLFSHCFSIRTNRAFHDKIVADLYCALVDKVITNHTHHDVTLDGALIWQVVFIRVRVCAVLAHLACLNTFATTRIVEHHELCAVAEWVFIHFFHRLCHFLSKHFVQTVVSSPTIFTLILPMQYAKSLFIFLFFIINITYDFIITLLFVVNIE